MKPDKTWELGLKARCWHCNSNFTKLDYYEQCGYYICPICRKCACQLSNEQKNIVDCTFEALAPILSKAAKDRVGIHGS